MNGMDLPIFPLGDPGRKEIQVSGFGGQGVVMTTNILGRVATVEEGRNSVMTQSYGPESRGGASLAELIIDAEEIGYPRVTQPDLAVVLSGPAYEKYGRIRPEGTLLIVERDLVDLSPADEESDRVLRVPATRIAEDLGRRIVTNIVVLGFLCATTELMPAEALRRGIAASVPSHTEQLNMDAFEAGRAYAQELAGGAAAEKEVGA